MSEEAFGEAAAGKSDFCAKLFSEKPGLHTATLERVAEFIRTKSATGPAITIHDKRKPLAQDGTIGEFDYDRRMEIYKVMVESAERGIDRRYSQNQFYFSVFVAIFVSISFVLQSENEAFPSRVIVMSALMLGFLNSLLWLSTIFAARRLSASKYDAIGEIEKFLEFAPFTREWEIHIEKRRNFPRFTLIEQALPAALAVICISLFNLIVWGVILI
ncbi:MAG: hypothetical protein AAGJ84_07710 [Pseudomonadota bacterium]